MRWRFLQGDLADIGRIGRNPPEPLQEYLRATMLSFRNGRAGGSEALVAEVRWSNPYTIDIPRRDSGCPRKTNKERVEIGALAAEIARFQHRSDISGAASARGSIAERVLDNPFIDGASPAKIGLSPGRNLVGGFFDNSVNWNELGAG